MHFLNKYQIGTHFSRPVFLVLQLFVLNNLDLRIRRTTSFWNLKAEGIADEELVTDKRCNELSMPIVFNATDGLPFLENCRHFTHRGAWWGREKGKPKLEWTLREFGESVSDYKALILIPLWECRSIRRGKNSKKLTESDTETAKAPRMYFKA